MAASTYLKLELLSLFLGDSFFSLKAPRVFAHLFEAGAFVTTLGGEKRRRICGRFHLFEAGAFVTFASIRLPHHSRARRFHLLKLELLSPPCNAMSSMGLMRFHLFEAGAFVTFSAKGKPSPVEVRFHLFEAGAFVTITSLTGVRVNASILHLFEVELLSLDHERLESSLRKSARISTYLKLELLSPRGFAGR